jgi:hypothetical protein
MGVYISTPKKFNMHYKTLLFSSLLFFAACKGKNATTGNTDSTAAAMTDTVATMPAPTPATTVEVAQDDALTTGAKDATKDFPGVTATVADGEITLTGDITRAQLQTLMQSLNSLHPKKINNNLTIK